MAAQRAQKEREARVLLKSLGLNNPDHAGKMALSNHLFVKQYEAMLWLW